MAAHFRLNGFVEATRSAYTQPQPKILYADPHSLEVTAKPAPRFTNAKAENRKTWEIFFTCLNETIGKEKVDWICNRYRDKYNFQKLAKNGSPLLPKHIQAISAASSQIRASDIKRIFHGAKLKTITARQMSAFIGAANPFPWIGKKINPFSLWGSPSKLSAFFFHDKVLMDREKQSLFDGCTHLSPYAWLERLTKVIVNRELFEGQIIPSPDRDGQVDYYRIYKKIATGDGLVAYALKPCCKDSKLQPLLVFRPTQWCPTNEDFIESLCNDVEPNIGELGWKRAEPHFQTLLADPHFRRNNQKINIAGFSLGGAHAQRFLAKHYDFVSTATFYADPAVDDKTAQAAADKINAMPRRPHDPLYIEVSRAKGDYCHYVGDKHVGWNISHPDVNVQLLEIDHNNKQIEGSYLHATRFFDSHEFNYRVERHEDRVALGKHLDNTQRGFEVLSYENSRQVWGRAVYFAIMVVSGCIRFFSGMFGLKVLRKSNETG